MPRSLSRQSLWGSLIVGLLLIFAAREAKAGFSLVTDPSQVGPHISGNWNHLNPQNSPLASPITITIGGVTMTVVADRRGGVSHGQAISVQDIGGDIYLGSSNSGQFASASLTFIFDSPIRAFGAPISAQAGVFLALSEWKR